MQWKCDKECTAEIISQYGSLSGIPTLLEVQWHSKLAWSDFCYNITLIGVPILAVYFNFKLWFDTLILGFDQVMMMMCYSIHHCKDIYRYTIYYLYL